MNEVLILVDDGILSKGHINNLIDWGLDLDSKYNSLLFRGGISVFNYFKESHMEYFDEKQVLGRIFIFLVNNPPNSLQVEKIAKFPLFSHGYWSVYEIPAYILLIHRGLYTTKISVILEENKAIPMINSSFFLPKSALGLIQNIFMREQISSEEFSIFKVYYVGSRGSIDVWKSTYYIVF